jgi:RNA 2',3'-cyclic 3'-phosphodiesterase
MARRSERITGRSMTAPSADQAPSRANPRLFVAIPLSHEARAAIEAVVEEVRAEVDAQPGNGASEGAKRGRAGASAVRWVRMDGLHLTLRFLGPTPADRVAELAEAIDRVARDATPFELALAGAGAFPSAARPRTLWIGLTDGRDNVAELARRLATRLNDVGVPPEERPFKAHLTLGRADGRREGPAAARLLAERAATLRVVFRADRLVLFESVTGGGPARYIALHGARFGRR